MGQQQRSPGLAVEQLCCCCRLQVRAGLLLLLLQAGLAGSSETGSMAHTGRLGFSHDGV